MARVEEFSLGSLEELVPSSPRAVQYNIICTTIPKQTHMYVVFLQRRTRPILQQIQREPSDKYVNQPSPAAKSNPRIADLATQIGFAFLVSLRTKDHTRINRWNDLLIASSFASKSSGSPHFSIGLGDIQMCVAFRIATISVAIHIGLSFFYK
ncbi:hypothetical protein H5410_035805 [Solanum commersonii]|uniref:Uncharacterized protein n=1 Tax=Solanum commersonii TaxID=4109 RepID=A0A9J5Y2X9_SOLCO|nr:hypothetical protein H5410_035805 [Solanum commersonii]